jgi:hypothetical protein
MLREVRKPMTKSIPDQVISAFLERIKSENVLNAKGHEAICNALVAEQFKKKDVEDAIHVGIKDENP